MKRDFEYTTYTDDERLAILENRTAELLRRLDGSPGYEATDHAPAEAQSLDGSRPANGYADSGRGRAPDRGEGQRSGSSRYRGSRTGERPGERPAPRRAAQPDAPANGRRDRAAASQAARSERYPDAPASGRQDRSADRAAPRRASGPDAPANGRRDGAAAGHAGRADRYPEVDPEPEPADYADAPADGYLDLETARYAGATPDRHPDPAPVGYAQQAEPYPGGPAAGYPDRATAGYADRAGVYLGAQSADHPDVAGGGHERQTAGYAHPAAASYDDRVAVSYADPTALGYADPAAAGYADPAAGEYPQAVPDGSARPDGPRNRTEVLINRGRRPARHGARRWRTFAIVAGAVAAVALLIAVVLPGGGASWPASVATVQSEITIACQNANVVSEPSQVNFACAKDTRQILWVFSLLTSYDNPGYSDPSNGRKGLEPIQPAQGGNIAWSLNLHHPYNPASPVDSLEVAARAINNIIGGATVTGSNGTPVVQPGLESTAANCATYTGSPALITRQGFPPICALPVTTAAGQAALVTDVFKEWMVDAPSQYATEAGVLFENANNPGDPQVQSILNTLRTSAL